MKRLVTVLFTLVLATPCHAWNATGHKAIALIAYGHLSSATKARVDELLAKHPDYPKWIAAASHADRGRVAFMEVSVWADAIRNDSRFHADNARPTPNIPGLPVGGQARRAGWHFMNIPFSTDGT